MSLSCKYLFISIAIQSYMEKYQYITSFSAIFKFGTFFNVSLSESSCIFALGLSSLASKYFPSSLSIRRFFHVHFISIFSPKLFCFLIIQLLVCLCAFSPYLLIEFCCCFGMSCFVCIVLLSLHIFLVFFFR